MITKKNILIIWIVIAFMATFTSSVVYLVSQQSVRLGANEIPAQLATETSIKLQSGQSAKKAIPTVKVEITKSLNAFIMVFNNNKNLVATSGMIGDFQPIYPTNVLDNVSEKNDSRVTWQPTNGLRYATVAIKYSGGYIVAARSLLETEKLIDKIGKLVCITWIACIAFLTFALGAIALYFKRRRKENNLQLNLH